MKNPSPKQVLSLTTKISLELFLFSFTIFSTTVIAESTLSSYQTVYTSRLGGISIEIARQLSQNSKGEYQLKLSVSSMLAGFTETSSFEVDSEQIRPQKYRYKGSGLNRRESSSLFDWPANIVRSHYKGKWYQLAMQPGLHDRLSWQEQMRLDLINGSLEDSHKISIFNGKRIKQYQIQYLGEEVLDTPLGKLSALHYARAQENSAREFHVWLAKDWDYLLLKVVQIEPGESPGELLLKKAQLNGKNIKALPHAE